jgi:hypothetical protein
VRGCYVRRDIEPSDQPEAECDVTVLVAHGHLRGLVTLPSGIEMVCGAVAIREDDGPDWLHFYLPLGALGRVDRRVGGFPVGPDGGPGSLAWRRPLDDGLMGVGRQVFAQVDYQLAVIGFEASGQVRSSDLPTRELPSGWGYAIPDSRQLRYVPART